MEEEKKLEKGGEFEKARQVMRDLAEKYDKTTDSKAKIDLNLYEFPKMIEAIKAANDPSLESTPEYKRMQKYGLDYFGEIKHQTEIENAAQGYAETKE